MKDYKECRDEFIKDKSDSIKRSMKILFKKIDNYEKETGLIFEEFTEENFNEFAKKELVGKSANSTVVKVSLLKKYAESLDKYFIKLRRDDVIKMVNEKLREEEEVKDEDKELKYISWEEFKNNLYRIENDIDKAILCLLRCGVSGDKFSELVNLKTKDIDLENGKIYLEDRAIDIDDNYVIDVLRDAIKQRTYVVMVHDEDRAPKIPQYDFNMNCEYLLKQRPIKSNNNGLNPYRFGGITGKIFRLFQEFGMDISAINLLQSNSVDKIIEYEDEIGGRLCTREVNEYLKSIGCRQNGYEIRLLAKWVRSEYGR